MKIVINGRPVWVNYHHLYCFFVIFNEGSLVRASERLGIGQSALSIQMKQFEEQIGFSLFERSHRKIKPNERGSLVHSYAKEIFRLGGEMVETLLDQPTQKRIHIEIGALDTIPKHLTVQIVKAAQKIRPCQVSVSEGKQRQLLDDLTRHKIDLLVSNFLPSVDSKTIYARRISRMPLWVVGGKSFLKYRKNFPQSLDRLPFIVPTHDSRVRQDFESFCKQTDIFPDLVVESQDVMVQKLLAIEELGLTVIPEFAVREYLEKKDLFRIGVLKNLYEDHFLISASRKIENPLAAILMKTFAMK
jgi:LysR family transcriptional regulator, transcriptional activator of nhaA